MNLKKRHPKPRYFFSANYKAFQFLEGWNSSLAQSAGESWPVMAMGIKYPGSAFVEVEFLPHFWFLSHHFGSRYARKPIKGFKDLDDSLDSKKNWSQKMVRYVAAQVQVKLAKKCKPPPLMTSPKENTKSKSNRFFSIKTRRLPESVEGLNNSVAQSAGELWP